MFSFSVSNKKNGDISIPASTRSRRLRVRSDLEHAIDVEHDHELAFEPMHAAGKPGHAWIEVDRILLTAFIWQPQHLSDLVDQKAIGFTAQVDADRHRRLSVGGLGQPEAGAHVDHRDDAAAQIEDA